MSKPNPGRFRSGVRKWQIKDDAKHQGIVMDTGKSLLSYNRKRYWIRFETTNKLYIYSILDVKDVHHNIIGRILEQLELMKNTHDHWIPELIKEIEEALNH